MSEKLYFGNRAAYIQFRFEDSLRKYQPPPRKKVKLNSSAHQRCLRKSCQSAGDSRLIRLCQTRKIYHATSREKASQFSKKKQALNESAKKASGHVSDFNCSDHLYQNADQPISSTNQFECKDTIMNNNSAPKPNPMMDQLMNWTVQIRQTPIKQLVRNQLNKICMNNENSQYEQKSQKQQQMVLNQFQIKDIDFHIGLVEQLHQKIFNQYFKIEPQSKLNQSQCEQNQSNIQTKDNNEIKYTKQFQIKQQSRILQQSNSDQIEDEHKSVQRVEQGNGQMQMGEINLQKMQSQTLEKYDKQVNKFERTEEMSDMKAEPETEGRIRLKGARGECYLSARVIYKLCSSNNSPNRITKAIIRHHPYLQNATELMEIIRHKHAK